MFIACLICIIKYTCHCIDYCWFLFLECSSPTLVFYPSFSSLGFLFKYHLLRKALIEFPIKKTQHFILSHLQSFSVNFMKNCVYFIWKYPHLLGYFANSYQFWRIQFWSCEWDSLIIRLCVCVSHLSHVWLFAIPWIVACQAPLSRGFSRQEYWSGLPCSPPGNLPDPGIEPTSLMSPELAGGFFTTRANRKHILVY